MKRFLLIITICITSFTCAQQEIKIDIADALILKTIEISYEYYIADQSSVGLSTLFSFEKRTSDFRYNEEKMITPYFRHYFTKDNKWNLFGESFFAISSGYKEIKINGTSNTYERFSDGAIGIAAGTKYVSKEGIVIDIYGGIGRNLFSANSPLLVPRLGVNIGWRF
jgi:hypothetical protein